MNVYFKTFGNIELFNTINNRGEELGYSKLCLGDFDKKRAEEIIFKKNGEITYSLSENWDRSLYVEGNIGKLFGSEEYAYKQPLIVQGAKVTTNNNTLVFGNEVILNADEVESLISFWNKRNEKKLNIFFPVYRNIDLIKAVNNRATELGYTPLNINEEYAKDRCYDLTLETDNCVRYSGTKDYCKRYSDRYQPGSLEVLFTTSEYQLRPAIKDYSVSTSGNMFYVGCKKFNKDEVALLIEAWENRK